MPARPPKRRRPTVKTQRPAPAKKDERGERLQKVLAAAGLASRRECEQYILEGRVEVDGDVVTELGTRVDTSKQRVYVDGEALTATKRVYFAINKPEGVVCTARDPSGRPRVTDLLPPEVGRVFNVGRLDMASEGLILLTNDGDLANQLAHPKHGVQKTYHVQVAGHITPEKLEEGRKGVYLADGKAQFVGAKIKSRLKKSTVLEVILDEGRNREIRRVLARLGHKVMKLTRIAVGPVRLGEMPPGSYRPLTHQEVKALREHIAISHAARGPAPRKRPQRKYSPRPTKPPVSKSKGGNRSVIS